MKSVGAAVPALFAPAAVRLYVVNAERSPFPPGVTIPLICSAILSAVLNLNESFSPPIPLTAAVAAAGCGYCCYY